MRTLTGRLFTLLIAGFMGIPVVSAGDPRFTGAFTGTGRACYGALYIKTRTISWLTPFSQCQKVPYEVIERVEKGHKRQFTFRLKQQTKGCRYRVLYLLHRDTPDPDIDWDVVGYASLESYEADKRNDFKALSPDALACYLVTR